MANENRLIDADALWHKTFTCEDAADVRKEIENAPTVDARPVVHGRWETANDGTHFCSHCGCDAPYTWDDIDRSFINSADDVPDRISNYCPNCGALMKDGDGDV